MDAKIALSSTDSTEIDFTYTGEKITAILNNNTIDISRLQSVQIDTAHRANTLVKRGTNGYIYSRCLNFNFGLRKYEYNFDWYISLNTFN